MCDKFNQEIEKILLDKGILAIIAVVVTFCFSRILENFKAKSALGNIVYNYGFNAYNEILKILIRHGHTKRQLINKLIEVQVQLKTPDNQIDFMNSVEYENNTGTSFNKEFDKLNTDFKKLSQEFANSFEEINESVNKSILFLSENFVSKLNLYINSFNQYRDTLEKFGCKINKESVEPVLESLSDKKSVTKFAFLQKQMLDELDGRIV